jgi:hypothetical protein
MTYSDFIKLSSRSEESFKIKNIEPIINQISSIENTRNPEKLKRMKASGNIAGLAIHTYLIIQRSILLVIGFVALILLWLYLCVVQKPLSIMFKTSKQISKIGYLTSFISTFLMNFIVFAFTFKTNHEFLTNMEYLDIISQFKEAKEYYYWDLFLRHVNNSIQNR